MTCKDEVTIAGDVEALKAKYHDIQDYTGVKHSFLGTFLDQYVTGMSSINMSMFIADELKVVESGSVVTPAAGTLFMINESSLLLEYK